MSVDTNPHLPNRVPLHGIPVAPEESGLPPHLLHKIKGLADIAPERAAAALAAAQMLREWLGGEVFAQDGASANRGLLDRRTPEREAFGDIARSAIEFSLINDRPFVLLPPRLTARKSAPLQQEIERLKAELAKSNAKLSQAEAKEAAAARKALIDERGTGLPNRRARDLALRQQFALAQRTQQPLTFIAIDLDDFKQHNDEGGHSVGDSILKSVAEILQEDCRASDLPTHDRDYPSEEAGVTPSRDGGDEFGMLLPCTDSAGGALVAERLRAKVEAANLGVTLSIGVHTFDPTIATETTSPEALVVAADKASIASKRAGKNRVTVYAHDTHKDLLEIKGRS